MAWFMASLRLGEVPSIFLAHLFFTTIMFLMRKWTVASMSMDTAVDANGALKRIDPAGLNVEYLLSLSFVLLKEPPQFKH